MLLLPTLSYCFTVTLLLGVGYICQQWAAVLSKRRKMPPGPFPWPLVGNLFQLPREKQWERLGQWSNVYRSPIITYWEGSKATIVCNDAWTASELNDRRAAIYSSRPFKTVTGKLFGLYDSNQAGLPYGDRWRLHRRLTHVVTNATVVKQYQSFQGAESKVLIRDLLADPERFFSYIERYTVSVVSTIAWGRRINKLDDPVLKVAQAFVGSSSLALPGRCYTEAIPILANVPNFLNSLPGMMKTLADTSNKYFYALSEEGARQPEDNFAKRLLKHDEEELSKVDIANLTGNFVGAGVDTSSSALISCILAMCLFPRVQAIAHAELDRVVGRNASPSWLDESQLPYIRAIVQETLRWRPVFPLGGPQHCPTRDDEYKGFFIPKGTPILGNLYSINRNPNEYPDPDDFRPERFIGDLQNPFPNRKGHNVFGWGRRVCSGEPLAQQSLFYTAASLLWAFEVKPALNEKGEEESLDPWAYNNMQVNRPLPFRARFIPRTGEIAAIVQKEADIALDELKKYDGETKVTMESAQGVQIEPVLPAVEKS